MDSSLVVKSATCHSWLFIKQVGYFFAPSGKPYPDNWIVTDVIYEFERSLLSRQVSMILISKNLVLISAKYLLSFFLCGCFCERVFLEECLLDCNLFHLEGPNGSYRFGFCH